MNRFFFKKNKINKQSFNKSFLNQKDFTGNGQQNRFNERALVK